MSRAFLQRISVLACLAVVLCTPLACTPRVDSRQAAVVRSYGQALPSALSAQTLEQIAPFATTDQVDSVRLFVVRETEEYHRRVQARLLDQTIISTESTGQDKAAVLAKETWSMVKMDSSTGAVVSKEEYTETYEYSLVRVNGTWRVNAVAEKDAD